MKKNVKEFKENFKIDFRPYRYKDPKEKFFCPLCKTERAFTVGHRLTTKHYFQILIVTAFVSLLLYPLMGFEGLFSFFAVWAGFEIGIRASFRKEIPCPHCGFDASWYKKDITVAKKLVDEFWQARKVEEEKESASVTDGLNDIGSQIPEPQSVEENPYFN